MQSPDKMLVKMKTTKSSILVPIISIISTMLFTGCAVFPPLENNSDSSNSLDIEADSPKTLKSVLNEMAAKPDSYDATSGTGAESSPTTNTFTCDEYKYTFEYPAEWTHISNWQGERGEIFVNNPDPDLFNDPRKNNAYFFIDHSSSYELVGWEKFEQKEMENKYGEKFKLNYYSPDEEYYINRGVTYLTPPQTETLITVESDIIPGSVHYKYDSAKDELGEVGLMEVLNTLTMFE